MAPFLKLPADTAKPSSKQRSTSKGTPEALIGQESVLKPPLRERSQMSSFKHGDSHGPQESPLSTSSMPDCRTVIGEVNADSARRKITANSPQLTLQAELKQGNEGKSFKTVENVKGKSLTQASSERGRLASSYKSSILSLSNHHEIEETSKTYKGNHDITKKSSKNCGTKTNALPVEMSSPVRMGASRSDSEETSNEHCLMSYTALPSTPEKKMGRICHSIVKEGKAMVAIPSPSKPHPLPKLMLPQRSLFKDQMDMASSAEEHLSFSSTSCSLQSITLRRNERNQRAGVVFDNHTQLDFSNRITVNNATEDLDQGERRTAEGNLLRDLKESISVSRIGDDPQSPQSEKESQNLVVPQGIRNEQVPRHLGECTYVCENAYERQKYKRFRGDYDEKVEEEEDSDVLRIEEHSENENDSFEVINRINLDLSDMINIFSLNFGHENDNESRQHTPSPPTTKQKKKEKNSISPRRKTQVQNIQKPPSRGYTTPDTPKRPLVKKKSKGGTPGCHAWTKDHNDRTEVGRASSVRMQSSISHKFQSSAEEHETPLRSEFQEAGCYAGLSRPVERKRESRTTSEKRRRITPIRIGDVEQHQKDSKASWGKLGTPKELHWGQSRGCTGVRWET